MNARRLIIAYLIVLLAGLIGGHAMGRLPAGLPSRPWAACESRGQVIYPPWAIFIWARDFGRNIPKTLNEGYAFIGGSIHSGHAHAGWQAADCAAAFPCGRSARTVGPASRDMKRAGLLTGQGTVLGHAFDRYLTYDGPEHQLVSGASRSGKGVGHVIPTLLNWNGSVLAYDVKNELWDVTAGMRSQMGYCAVLQSDPARQRPIQSAL